MISVQEATAIIAKYMVTCPIESISLEQSIGRILAEELRADRPFPPFDRVTMDGIALRYADFATGQRDFLINGVQPAGVPQTDLKNRGEVMEVMTGAVLPAGADTVIRYEDLQLTNGYAKVMIEPIQQHQNIHPVASDKQMGDLLVPSGVKLYPSEIGTAATIGKSVLKVKKMPVAAVISTGDELVEIDTTPLPHQIRRSNVYVVQSILKQMGVPSKRFHLIDNQAVIKKELKKILKKYSIIILSGAVSEGKFDYLPAALQDLGVVKRFHKVAQRPGKPFWFGTYGFEADDNGVNIQQHQTNQPRSVVFALPGNPVSTTVCAYKYVLPYLRACAGVVAPPQYARLATDFSFAPKLNYFLPVYVYGTPEGFLEAIPHAGQGSGDLSNLNRTNGWLELPAERNLFKKGEVFPLITY
jgi:molybdopterin molybdotransferase